MSTPLFDPDNARDRLLAGAARLFHVKGYAATTVRAIGAEVGILSGSLFHHVRSKEDLLFQVMERVIGAMLRDLGQALATAAGPRDRLRALVHVELAYLHGPAADATAVLFHEWRALSEDRRAVLLAGRDAYFARWHQVLTEARSRGLIHAEPAAARQLLHGALAWTSYWFRPDGPMDLDGLTDQVMAMIAPPPALAPARAPNPPVS
ncbi:MAG: TetR/AcrR family transcriptional regulator [Rhodobacter sp.]|uniref:TetR/AcrR family transcriptional regulator n=1 Tax=Pararhodobacter sp. TaxID=2127056 RepID=UPI001D991274|nr:TetR/AcrR family transcriptional regulator [Pararhodobacter sp.]MCB1345684.1 TetR family transcriptional regulator [Paracoccaceae bacterium]MCC0074743.1 TetR/AcrR family transcriptional regulator [Rhodobacter sp.]HPD93302.1 TetR/AcrR family transcriptional regulator [Pararhodobacter sp.]